MKKLTLADLMTISSRHRISAALALVLIASFGDPATAGTPANAPHGKSQLVVNNAATRKLVSDAEKASEGYNFALAAVLLQKAVNASPRDGVLRAQLGRTFLKAGDPASAERELRRALGDGAPEQIVLPSLFGAMLARHEEIKLLDEFPDPAANAHDAAIVDTLKGRAQALQALGRADDAAAAMDRALSLRRDAAGLLLRANLATQQNDPSLARTLTDEAFRLRPNSEPVLLAKLAILRLSNDATGTLALSEQILRQFPNSLPTKLTRIDTFLKLNQDSKAKAEVDALLAKMPRVLNAIYYRALLLARANNANAAWQVARTIPPDFIQERPLLAAQVSQMAIRVGNVETGGAILAGALMKSPDQLDLRLRLANVRMGQNSPQAALTVMGPIKGSPNPQAMDLLAQIYLKLGKYGEALEVLKKMQKTNPKRAISLLTSTLHHEPALVDFMDTLGLIKVQMKDSKGALEQLARAHNLRPNDGEITFHLVQALDADGNRKSARGLLKTLLDSGVSFDDLPQARQLAASWH